MTQAAPRPQLAHLTRTLDELRAKGTHFKLRVLDDQQAPVCHYDGREVINLASNNYLGLANHAKLIEASLAATRAFGVGSGAVRTIAGTMRIHMELEEKIARFKDVEACVVFQSGFAANAGTVSAILGKEDFILSDELNHASIIDGARLSRATIKVFRHKDAAHCEELLQSLANEPGHKLVITDGVFSMDGDIGPVDKLAPLAEKYGAIMMVDDAHASGVLGRNGRGSVDHFGMHGLVDVQVGTLSKAIGALGGYVCGSRDLIDYLYHRARPFLFSTSHPPSVAATCIAAFDILEKEPERILRLWSNTRYFQGELKRVGFNIGGVDTPATETPITPIIVGDGRAAMEYSRALFDEGVMATGIAFPTVPEGKARIRAILSSEHTKAHLDRALEVFERVAKRLGILQEVEMIAHLRGKLIFKQPGQAIVEAAGVGYDVAISVPTFTALPSVGAEAALHIHTQVSDDQIALFGFLDREEKRLFERLITVSGVGPKLAIKMLSGLSPEHTVQAIRAQDHAQLTRIPGVGKKLAERLVVELKDKLDDFAVAPVQQAVQGAAVDDVLSALVNLGYQRPAAEKAIEQAVAREESLAGDFDGLFRGALKIIR